MDSNDLFVVSPYDGTLRQPTLIFPKEIEAVESLLDRLEQRWITKHAEQGEFYAYTALPLVEFLRGLRLAKGYLSGLRFMDIGCGVGRNLAIAHLVGFETAGLDRHLPYIEAARELVPEADLIHADLREIESFDADLIYMYRPGVSDELKDGLERHVIDGMKSGSVLFLPARELNALDGMVKLDRWLWVKS